jgi:hypothetical protein
MLARRKAPSCRTDSALASRTPTWTLLSLRAVSSLRSRAEDCSTASLIRSDTDLVRKGLTSQTLSRAAAIRSSSCSRAKVTSPAFASPDMPSNVSTARQDWKGEPGSSSGPWIVRSLDYVERFLERFSRGRNRLRSAASVRLLPHFSPRRPLLRLRLNGIWPPRHEGRHSAPDQRSQIFPRRHDRRRI